MDKSARKFVERYFFLSCCVTFSMNEVLSKLSDEQNEEIGIIESIIGISDGNRDEVNSLKRKRKRKSTISSLVASQLLHKLGPKKGTRNVLSLSLFFFENTEAIYVDAFESLKQMLQVRGHMDGGGDVNFIIR
jgi:hypothetical protein